MVFDVSISTQTLLFLRAIFLGVVMMLFYDLFRILRIALPSPKVVVLAQDILYVTVLSVVSFLFLVSSNFGEIRVFVLLGEFLGMALCYFTLSQLLMASSRAIISAVRKIFLWIKRLILRPVYRITHRISRKIIRFVNFIGNLAKKTCRKAKFSLKRQRVLVYNLIELPWKKSGRKKDVSANALKKTKGKRKKKNADQ